MVVFTHFDTKTFEECLKYIQDSLDWLANSPNNPQLAQPVISQDRLMQAANTLSSLSYSAKRSHNDMALVNRLPPEILSQVFLYIQGDLPQMPFSPSPRSDPSLYLINLVCRHWQWVLISNPALWTRIYLSSRAISGQEGGISLELSRSRDMPLTVYIDHTLEPRHMAEPQGLQVLLHARRIQDLRMLNPSSKVLNYFLNIARELRVVAIIGGRMDPHFEEFRWTLPRLEVLSAYRTSVWQKWRTGSLRYLSLSSQTWRSGSAESMVELFKTNPHLEELMLDAITVLDSDWDDVNFAVESRLPLALPNLCRMLVQEKPSRRGFVSCPLSTIVSRITIPDTCARCFDLSGANPSHLFSDVRNGFPATRVHLNDVAAVGTDDISSWAVKHSGGRHGAFLTSNISPAEVEELWLVTDALLDDNIFLDSLLAMHDVTKLVFTRSFSHWAGKVSQCFDHLIELQLHTQTNKDEQGIIGFLKAREDRGIKLEMLRFVREPTKYDNTAFFLWEKDLWKFARHVGKVVFEERCNDGTDPDYFDFKLPDVCNTPSPVHSDWKPWKEDLMR